MKRRRKFNATGCCKEKKKEQEASSAPRQCSCCSIPCRQNLRLPFTGLRRFCRGRCLQKTRAPRQHERAPSRTPLFLVVVLRTRRWIADVLARFGIKSVVKTLFLVVRTLFLSSNLDYLTTGLACAREIFCRNQQSCLS